MVRTHIIAILVLAAAGHSAAAQSTTSSPKRDSTPPMPGMSMPDSMPGMEMPDSAKKPAIPRKTTPPSRKTPDVPLPAPSVRRDSMPGMTMPKDTSMSADAMMIGPLGISMDRMGSGTTWIPDAVTMPSRRRMLGRWMVMGHGFAFAQYDRQQGPRGGKQFGSLNWMMLMATRELAGGRFQARTMLSLDPLTVTPRGYPLLLQSGEAYNGASLHDRQHPHDFWMELGALYQRQINKTLAWSVYAAPSGEPALGPVAFMHRPSAMDNLTAPISHHWQDATHVSFGVLTAGIIAHNAQLEASVFNGREPDQNRWDFDPVHLDSYSARLTVNPDSAWSATFGYGYLKSPEALHPEESVHRVTASVLHGKKLGAYAQWSSALIFGANKSSRVTTFSKSTLVESEAILDRRNTVFGRFETVEKSAEDLDVPGIIFNAPSSGVAFSREAERFTVSAFELGYIRELFQTHWATVGLGAAGTINFVPSSLEETYGSANPLGAMLFVRLRPFHLRGAAGAMMRMDGNGGN